MIGVKATKAEESSPTSSRDRYLLKGAVFAKTPIYLGLLLVGFVLYLKTYFPSQAAQGAKKEPAPVPEEEERGELAPSRSRRSRTSLPRQARERTTVPSVPAARSSNARIYRS